ncbi:MAG: T9SS type A sorting domain-containing protein [Hyphomicrobiales bacterium]
MKQRLLLFCLIAFSITVVGQNNLFNNARYQTDDNFYNTSDKKISTKANTINNRAVGNTTVIFENLATITGSGRNFACEFDGVNYWVAVGNKGDNWLYVISPEGDLVASYSQTTYTYYGISGLEYNPVEGKMYASDAAGLYEINTKTGAVKTIFANQTFSMLGLAYDGEHFYTKNFNEDLIKFTRDGTVVEAYELNVPAFGMVYDYEDDCLWAFCERADKPLSIEKITTEGVATGDVIEFPTFDYTVHSGGLFYNYSTIVPGKESLVALIQSSDDKIWAIEKGDGADLQSPNMVTDLTVTPDINGAINGVISWINPNLTVNGDPLTDLTTIKVYSSADDYTEPIHTVDNPVVAESISITLEPEQSGWYSYKVVPENSLGTGIYSYIRTYYGEDVPSTVGNLAYEVDDMQVTLTWEAPTAGANGYYFSGSNITYKIVRYPDEEVVAEGLTELTFTETLVTEQGYRYEVFAYNHIGIGPFNTTKEFFVGDFLIYENFEGDELPEGWEVIGVGELCWYVYPTELAGGYPNELNFLYGVDEVQGKSYFTSPAINTTGMSAIDLSFNHIYNLFLWEDINRIGVVTTSDNGVTWNEAWMILPEDIVGPENKKIQITTPDVGSENFRIAFLHDGGNYPVLYWSIDDIIITEGTLPAVDLKCLDVDPDDFYEEGTEIAPSVRVYNNGTDEVTAFDVEVFFKNNDGVQVYNSTETFNQNISHGDTVTVTLNETWTAVRDSAVSIIANVIIEGDAYQENSSTETDFHVYPTGTENYDGIEGVLLAEGLIKSYMDADNGALTPLDPWMYGGFYATSMTYDGKWVYVSEMEYYDNTSLIAMYDKNGARYAVCNIDNSFGFLTALAYDETTSKMFGVIKDWSGPTSRLVTINLKTGATTKIGDDFMASLGGFDFADDGFLYGPDSENDELLKIDPENAKITKIGKIRADNEDLDLQSSQDVSYHNGRLYTYTCALDYAYQYYGVYDLETAEFIPIAPTTDGTNGSVFHIFNTSETTYAITFSVTNNDNEALPGATITINGQDRTTNDKGVAIVYLQDGTHSYTAKYNSEDPIPGEVVVDGGDKTVDISFPVGINDVVYNNFFVYPNPTKDIVIVNSEYSIPKSIVVYDMKGEEVKIVENSCSVNLSDMSKGSYLLKINLIDGQSIEKKIVKQ